MKIDKNIVFIGTPGCGKSTVGNLVAKELHLPFCDVDVYIEKTMGKSIKDIFTKGEDYFREIESEAIREISNCSPQVISTGGGAVKIPSNMEVLSKNSVILFLNRPVDDIVKNIDISGRPLLASGAEKVYELYKERYPLYKKYCHYEIHNDRPLKEVVNEIVKQIQNML
jgi:shikimate kinase